MECLCGGTSSLNGDLACALLPLDPCQEFTASTRGDKHQGRKIWKGTSTRLVRAKKFPKTISTRARKPDLSARLTKSGTVRLTKFVFLTASTELIALTHSTPHISGRRQNRSHESEQSFQKSLSKKKGSYKCGRTRSFLTGFQFGGIKLKDRSAGGWRSGLQRSEK